MNTAVAKQEEKKISISNFLNTPKTAVFLEQTLGKRKSEFVSNLISISETDKNLSKCSQGELMKCALNATALNLPLNKNLGYAYVIAYNIKQPDGTSKMTPQFQMGYKGFIQLAIRSGQYKTINTCEVREGEIKRNKFTGHIEFLGENPDGEVIGYLAYIELLNGFQQSLYMSIEQVQYHAKKFSKTFNSYDSVWRKDFDAMAKKTVLKLLLNRYGVLSVEMQNAIEKDQTDSHGQYIDNPQNSRTVIDTEVITQEEPTEEIPTTEQKTEELDFNAL
jgi:hypothetical protein